MERDATSRNTRDAPADTNKPIDVPYRVDVATFNAFEDPSGETLAKDSIVKARDRRG